MKTFINTILITTLLVVFQNTFAQTVQSNFINYQGIARDASGEILAEEAITLDIELRYGAPNVGSSYSETHSVTTDAGGVFNIKIGNGTTTFGDYNNLNWGEIAFFVNVSLNGNEIGTTEMHAVPYALSSGDKLWNEFNGNINTYDNVGIGTSEPEEDLHIAGDLFVQSNSGAFHIGYPNNGNRWRVGTTNGGADLLFRSKESSSSTYNTRISFNQNGNVGIGETAPDEKLVIGENLGSGWTFPAITSGNSTLGGAVQVGTPTYNFSIESSSIFGYARLIANDDTGLGQGIIEMRTRQLNIGTSPGVSSNAHALRVVQPDIYGFQLENSNGENWEIYSAATGNLQLYANGNYVGQFDPTSGNYGSTSDQRLKTNINTTDNFIDKVTQLEAKTYNYKTNLNKKYIGFIAQELQEQFPEAVTENLDRTGKGESTYMVDYNQLSVIALQAIKEQQQLIEALKARIEVLENK